MNFHLLAIQPENQNEPKTEGEQILQLTAKNPGMSDYWLAYKLRVAPSTVKESRLNALRKLEKARVDLEFVDSLKSKV